MNEWQNLAPSWMRCQLNHNQSLGCCRGWWRCCSFCMGSDQQSIHRKQVSQQFWMKMWFSISCKSLSDLLCCTTFLDDFCLFLGLSHQSWTTWMLEFVHRELSPGSLPVSWYQILGPVKYCIIQICKTTVGTFCSPLALSPCGLDPQAATLVKQNPPNTLYTNRYPYKTCSTTRLYLYISVQIFF